MYEPLPQLKEQNPSSQPFEVYDYEVTLEQLWASEFPETREMGFGYKLVNGSYESLSNIGAGPCLIYVLEVDGKIEGVGHNGLSELGFPFDVDPDADYPRTQVVADELDRLCKERIETEYDPRAISELYDYYQFLLHAQDRVQNGHEVRVYLFGQNFEDPENYEKGFVEDTILHTGVDEENIIDKRGPDERHSTSIHIDLRRREIVNFRTRRNGLIYSDN